MDSEASNEKSGISLFKLLIIAIGTVLFVILGVIGWNIQDDTDNRLSMDGIAVLDHVDEQPYLYTSRYGGRVRQGTDYFGVYVFNIDGRQLYIHINETHKIDWPSTIDVKYNPTRVEEFMYDVSFLYNNIRSIWRYSDALRKSTHLEQHMQK